MPKSIALIIAEVFDDQNLVHSSTLIVKEVISNIRLLTTDADVLNYLEEVESNLSLLIGSAFANTSKHDLIEPAVAQAVAGIAAEQSVVEKRTADSSDEVHSEKNKEASDEVHVPHKPWEPDPA